MHAWYVEIRARDGSGVVERMGPHSECKAERIAAGASADLDHDRYQVLMVPADDDPEQAEVG